jgi:hypothetical protein
MNVRRRVVAEGAQVEALEQREHLAAPALAPGAAAEHLHAAEGGAHRAIDLGPIGCQVVGREPAAVVAVIPHHGGSEVAAVEGFPRRAEAGGTAAPAGRALLVRHELQRPGEIGLHEQLALARRPAAGPIAALAGQRRYPSAFRSM